MIDALVVDIETTSAVDLGSRGVHVYAADPSTRILCCAYARTTGGDPKVWRIDDGQPLEEFCEFLSGERLLIAHNANFERTVLGAVCPELKKASKWADSAMLSGVAGRPHSLRDACRSLKFPQELEKDARGKRLLNMLSIQSSKLYIGEYWNDTKAFDELCEYCRQDVRAERAIWLALEGYYTGDVRHQWILDCGVEDYGVPVDVQELSGAKALFESYQARAEKEALELTGGVPLRSTVGLRKWTAENGYPLNSFSRDAVSEALKNRLACDGVPKVERLLRLRTAVAGTAGKKFDAFIGYCCGDGRIRGSIESRVATTGRYAGRGIQPQNLPRGFIDPALVPYIRDAAYEACKDFGTALSMMALVADGQEVDALASLCRDSISAPDGKVFVVADYSAVEARVLAWLAGEAWVEEIFSGDGRIYERTAAKMYMKSVDAVTKHERMAGKIATLALGYGGGVAALQRFASAYGITFDDCQAQEIVDTWRASRPKTLGLWKSLNGAFLSAAQGSCSGVRMLMAGGRPCSVLKTTCAGRDVIKLFIPSGRCITYWDPRIDVENGEVLIETYKSSGAVDVRVYGGYLTENLTQAVAFDLLLKSLLAIDRRRDLCRIVMHIHDEIVVECNERDADAVVDFVKASMETTPLWAGGLVLKAEPEIMKRYKK